ncbi:unnamed protein product [Timema podura]|uniref:Uncharacterized protein n=1 Tax=Timema podura TaxID=61482 RepID=A0ABN7NZS7_TIMPD|nr:unnamed protein product [Timema podura]
MYTPLFQTADGYEEFVHLDVGDAIDIVKSESSHKLNTQLCMDITRALTDKLINTTSKNNFLRAPEEPAYVKQLKQLRWDHLKHIQREVQRLEELERADIKMRSIMYEVHVCASRDSIS